ncbi:MAG TPA: hypothetical protein VHQ43_06440 [Solirubrobacterales bacterium]|jgi:hypothetical protein|nr:hypothetical protein [Solirubrobacterales bacterium]
MRDRVPLRLPPLLTALLVVACLVAPSRAAAAISPVHMVDGPSGDVVAIEDAAMAEDGTGGLVYLRKEGGRNHVFVARFGAGWSAPQRVDIGQKFDSSWARIAAGDGGRLLLTWVQEFGAGNDRMFSATLDPGATGFEAPVPVDLNVGEATASFPDLAMNAGGQAYLTYLVITDNSTANPPGYLGIDVRVARYKDRLWSVLGNSLDRNPAIPMPVPTAAAGPKIGVDVNGNALVAWREPDDEFVNRVWARRVFGGTFGVPLLVSPSSWEGVPLRGAADAFSLDVAGFGQAAVALRQLPGQAGKIGGPRAFVNEIPDAFAEGAAAFLGPRLADGGERGGLGVPSVAVDPEGGFGTAFAGGAATLWTSGDNAAIGPTARIDDGGSAIAGEPQLDVAESGAAAIAWQEQRGGSGAVAAREVAADGRSESAPLSTPVGGTVGGLALAGSGLGDAIVAWQQGSGAAAQIAAATIDAPPEPMLVEAPEGWQRKKELRVSWEAAANAIGGLRYSVSIDDQPVSKPTRKLHTVFSSGKAGEGRHRLQVFAIDDARQETGSREQALLIDRRAPRVRLRRRGSRVAIRVLDGARRASSGFKRGGVKISFGDRGASASGSAPHRAAASRRRGRGKAKGPNAVARHHSYAKPGLYTIVVKAKDRAGNTATLRRKVRVG